MTDREKQARDMLQEIAKDIEKKLPEKMGFTLLAYEFECEEGNTLMYVSNSKKEDVLNAMVEFVQKNIEDPKIWGKDISKE